MKIAVFGSAKTKEHTQLYQDSVLLGRLLAERGHTVLTGGYSGTMEAVSKGAAEAGAHVIGVTCKELEDFRGARANQWVHEEWNYPTLHDRLNALIEGGDGAAIALPGGAGTLAEIIMLWNRMITEGLPRRPLVLIGKDWQAVFTTFLRAQSDYIDPEAAQFLMFAEDVPQTITRLFDHN
ncbi:MAG: LOG family protein [Anaerolineaceae bacterium]|nr:LOG family protein [Anaerolineaceae bacterium]